MFLEVAKRVTTLVSETQGSLGKTRRDRTAWAQALRADLERHNLKLRTDTHDKLARQLVHRLKQADQDRDHRRRSVDLLRKEVVKIVSADFN